MRPMTHSSTKFEENDLAYRANRVRTPPVQKETPPHRIFDAIHGHFESGRGRQDNEQKKQQMVVEAAATDSRSNGQPQEKPDWQSSSENPEASCEHEDRYEQAK